MNKARGAQITLGRA